MAAPTVLVVDDDSSFRRVVEYQLRQAGYDVLKAEDGKKALEIFSQSHCHAVLTDLDMPELSGNAPVAMAEVALQPGAEPAAAKEA